MDFWSSLIKFKPDLSKNSWRLLSALLVVDVCFILIHILFSVTGFSDDLNFRLSHERSYAEHMQYLKTLLTMGFFLYLAWHDQVWLFLTWGVLFGYIFLDDSLAIHEIVGEQMGGWFAFARDFSLRPQDIGEMAVFGLSSSILLFIIWVYYRWNDHEVARKASRWLIWAVLLLGFFGVFVDVIHSLVGGVSTSRALNILVTLLEEGSEHFILSGILVYVFSLAEEAFFSSERRIILWWKGL